MSFDVLESTAATRAVVRVNLLPPGIEQARRARRLRTGLGAGLVVVAAACGAAYVISAGHVSAAQDALDAEQSRTAALQAQQQPYAEVPKVLAEVKTVQAAREAVSSNDVPFYSYLDRLATSAPDELTLTSITFTMNAGGQSATTTDPLATPGIGSVAVTGKTTSQDRVASWLEAVDGIPGLGGSWLSNSSYDASSAVVTYTASGTITSSAATQASE